METLAVHGGCTPDPTTRTVAVPIYQTVTKALGLTSLFHTMSVAKGQVCDSAFSFDITADDQKRAPREPIREGTFHGLREFCP